MRDSIRQVANLIVIPAGVASSYVGAQQHAIAAVARANEPVLAASGWAFAIWGLIFFGQVAYAVYQAMPREAPRVMHRRIGALAAANSVLAAAWMYLFTHTLFTLAWLVMIAILANLVVMDGRIRGADPRGRDFWLVRLPYALNLGWICVAFVLNTAQFLHVRLRYDGAPLTPIAFAHVLVAIAALIGAALVAGRRNPVAAFAVAWGLVGVAAYERSHQSLSRMAATLAVGLVVFAVMRVATRPTWIPR